jgi:hypothetical protein
VKTIIAIAVLAGSMAALVASPEMDMLRMGRAEIARKNAARAAVAQPTEFLVQFKDGRSAWVMQQGDMMFFRWSDGTRTSALMSR